MEDSVTSNQGEWGFLGGWYCQSSLEGLIGVGQLSDRGVGELTRHASWIPDDPGDNNHLPQIQSAPAADRNEGRGPIQSLTQPLKGLWRIGQGEVSGDLGGLRDSTMDGESTHILLVAPLHGRPSRTLLCHPV